VIDSRLMESILGVYPLEPRGIHGLSHWARVLENGLRLSEHTGANPRVVELFAVFHDSQRWNDGHDPEHGMRGGVLAGQMRGSAFELDDAAFALLLRACERHTGGRRDPDATVLTCWDSDRLDLGRVGITPDPRYLCTPAARRAATIAWAHHRAQSEVLPERVAREWGIEL
jgi:uncharacterized protein